MFHVRCIIYEMNIVSDLFNLIFNSYNGEFQLAKNSPNFIHDGVQMTSYENEPFIIGDYEHSQIEFLHLSHEIWYPIIPYPFQTRIFGYSAVSRPSKVYLFGGCCEHHWRMVSLFENDDWSPIGELREGRINHLAISYGTDVMIIGGISKDQKP